MPSFEEYDSESNQSWSCEDESSQINPMNFSKYEIIEIKDETPNDNQSMSAFKHDDSDSLPFMSSIPVSRFNFEGVKTPD